MPCSLRMHVAPVAMLALAAMASFGASAVAADKPASRPNVVLIMTDDQGYGDLSAHGNPWIKTPNLDRLASQGIRLDDYHVSPYCVPTRAALKPAATATPGKVTLVMKEADLNKMAQDALAQQSDVSVSNVRVDLQPGKIIFSGRAVLGFFPVDLEITATLPVVNGRPEPEIVGVKLNGEEAGGFIRAQVVNMIQPYLDQFAQTDLNFYVEKIVITNDEILITGQYN